MYSKKLNRSSVRMARSGMSLIEIVVVLAIIGMLMAVVSMSLPRARMKGRITTTKASIGNIENALEMYNNETARYPSEEEGLEVLTRRLNGQMPILKPGELKDAWGREFVYRILVDEDQPFKISSAGDDGVHGSDDDISSFVLK